MRFHLVAKTPLDNLNSTLYSYRHLDTGLWHYHLKSQSPEKAFLIGFATLPDSSKGEAHILEHVVLCGSKKYPVRDPFFSMLKRSLQTFMNAMTASDWTVYPFATQNDKDYANLLSVYLDAVFAPNIHPLDFAQEGIRVVIDDDGQAQYHGIVFNEMKGAMSGDIQQLYYALNAHLFPSSTYRHNSGGDPAHIVDLTHQELLDFHKKYYHPSNAIAMSFGDIDVDVIHSELCAHLSNFDQGERFFVTPEKRLPAPIQVADTYTSDNDDEGQTYHTIAWLLPPSTDPKLHQALRLMEGVLLEHSGLPLRKYLETTPLGKAPSPLLGLDDSHYEMAFYVGLRGSDPKHNEQFLKEVLALLTQVASTPIDPDTIDAILHQMELDERHIGGDDMPYGLTLMLDGFGTAIHGGDPVDVWQTSAHWDWLKQSLKDPMWLPTLIKTHLIDNPHQVQLTLSPDSQKRKRQQQAENLRLTELGNTLDDNTKNALREQQTALLARQALIDDPAVLPKVELTDIPLTRPMSDFDKSSVFIDGTKAPLYQHHTGTNGLYYIQLAIELDQELSEHPLLPLYLSVLGQLGTTDMDAREFLAHQAAHSGGVAVGNSSRTCPHDKEALTSFITLSTQALATKPYAIDLVRQVLTDTVFCEQERLIELLTQKQLATQSRLSGAGHSYAMQTASHQFSRYGKLGYYYRGLPALKALKTLLADDPTTLSQALMALHKRVVARPKAFILVNEASESLSQTVADYFAVLPKPDGESGTLPKAYTALQQAYQSDDMPADIAWLIPTNVYHNAKAYPAVPAGHKDAAALRVLAVFLRNGYLHRHLREQGGAYGGGASYDPNTASFCFYSYRDPHCQDSFAHFDQAIDWLLTSEHDSEQLNEAILSVIAGIDKPLSPVGEAMVSCMNDLHGRDRDNLQKHRQAVLAVDIDTLKHVAKKYLTEGNKATLAPLDQEQHLSAMGFTICKL